nr:4107_t:CDS:2 [Entrophospora candida]
MRVTDLYSVKRNEWHEEVEAKPIIVVEGKEFQKQLKENSSLSKMKSYQQVIGSQPKLKKNGLDVFDFLKSDDNVNKSSLKTEINSNQLGASSRSKNLLDPPPLLLPKPTIYPKYNLRSNGKVKDNNGRKQHQTELARQKQIMA